MLLPVFLFFSIAFAGPLYASYNVSQSDIDNLRNSGCYRGTYGYHKLSLFTCPIEHLGLAPFIENLDGALLCVIEIRFREKAIEVAAASEEVEIIWSGRHELILASVDRSAKDYPKVCVSVTEYKGSAYNAMPVPRIPYAPLRPFIPTNVAAPNPVIQELLAKVTAQSLSKFDTELSNFNTRNSLSSDAKEAMLSIEKTFQLYGFQTSTQSFRTGYCNNVVAEKLGSTNPSQIVVVGAHADSRSTGLFNTTQRAPGADDNGTGTSTLLEIARVISEQNAKFDFTFRLAAFCGEEQGLYGSEALANEYAAVGDNVIAMFNGDMLGYNCGGKGTKPNLGVVRNQASNALTDECIDIIGDYLTSADLTIGDTTACCSDQESFFSAGFQAAGFFECPGRSVVYPDYHQSTDLPDKLDFNQHAVFTKAILSCAATKAQPITPQ